MSEVYKTFQVNQPLQHRLDFCLEHCLLAVAFFLPLSINITSVFLVGALFCWLGKMITSRRLLINSNPLDFLILLFAAVGAASIFASPDKQFSLYNYFHLMGRYLLLYYLIANNVQTIEQLKRLLMALLCSALLVVAYGFFQYFHGVDISAFEWVDQEQFPALKVRVFSTLGNPNLLAGFLVAMLAMALGLSISFDHRQIQLLLFGFIILLVTCLVLTYSRGAWLSAAAVVLFFGLYGNRKFLWLLLAVPLSICGQETALERLISIFHPTDTSASLRLALWHSTLAMIADQPWLGIGWGAYWLVYPRYDFFIQDPSTTIFHAHNMYLNIAAEIGIPGLLLFLAIWYAHVRLALTIVTISDNKWVNGTMLGVVGAFVTIAVSGFTDYILFNIQLAMLFWLLCGLVVAVREQIMRYSW